jgi:hypothetical protein
MGNCSGEQHHDGMIQIKLVDRIGGPAASQLEQTCGQP